MENGFVRIPAQLRGVSIILKLNKKIIGEEGVEERILRERENERGDIIRERERWRMKIGE